MSNPRFLPMVNIIPAIESPQIIMYNATFSVSPVFGADFFVSVVVPAVANPAAASMDADTTPVVAKADKKDAKTTKVVKADTKDHKTTKVVKSNKKAQSAPTVKAEKADKAHK